MSTYDPGNGSGIEPVNSQPEYSDFDAKRLTVGEMLTVYTSVLIELRRSQSHTNSTLIRTGQVHAGVAGIDVTAGLDCA
jgi:hypothetical protein